MLGVLTCKYAKVHLDDIFIYSHNIKEYLVHLCIILQHLMNVSSISNYASESFYRKKLPSWGTILMPMVFTLSVKRFLLCSTSPPLPPYHKFATFLGSCSFFSDHCEILLVLVYYLPILCEKI